MRTTLTIADDLLTEAKERAVRTQRTVSEVIEDAMRGYTMGFLTKEFTVERGGHVRSLLAVYVPTNHLYLGGIVICERERAIYPDIAVEEGIRIFLTGGMAFPPSLRGVDDRDRNKPGGNFRV